MIAWLLNWLINQKLSDWLQGAGSLAAAGAAVWIALRQERLDRHREEAARHLRVQVLAAAIVPVLRDLQTTVRVRGGMLRTISVQQTEEHVPHMDELSVLLPDIFMNTIDRIDVFGARIAAQIYTLVHRINDFNDYIVACRDWGLPHRSWDTNLHPKLDAIGETLLVLVPPLNALMEQLEDAGR